MKLVTARSRLAPMLASVQRATGAASSSTPVLAGVLLEVSGGRVIATGTDLDMTIRSTMELDEGEDGSAIVPAKLLGAILKSLSPGPVTLETNESGLLVSAGGARFTVRTFPVSEFPRMTDAPVDSISLPAADFCAALAQTVYAASKDDGRPILTGVFLSVVDDLGLRMVATDSYRMVVRDLPYLTDIPEFDNLLIPSRALGELVRMVPANADDDVYVGIGERSASFSFGNETIITRLLSGSYPTYEQLIPVAYKGTAIIGRLALLGALRRMVTLATERTVPVRLSLQNAELELSITQSEIGNASESVDCQYEGESLQTAFNPRYLSESLEATDAEDVTLSFVDASRPCAVQGIGDDGYTALLMPVRVP